MRLKGLLFLSIFFIKFHPSFAADSLAFSRNARTFETQQTSLITKGVALSCLSLIVVPDGLPCNPAQVPLSKKSMLGAEVQISNGSSNLDNVRKLLDGKISQDVVDSLFSEGKIIQIESSADILFGSPYLSGRFTPLSVKGLSVVRNEANPDVEIFAVEEKGFTFQSGYEILTNLYAGAQVRFVSRKFIRKQFKLTQLATEQGKDLLKPKEQTATYLEPGMTYFFRHPWKPRVSLFLANLGSLSDSYSDLPTPVEAQGGFGISPWVGWGDLELTLEYRSVSYEERNWEKLRVGALYYFGSMYLAAGADSHGLSAGVYYGLDKINAGILYSTTRLLNEKESNFTQTVYAQLGWQI